jgi:outer membrane protein OmpA-like peptidoglycan-associated protein
MEKPMKHAFKLLVAGALILAVTGVARAETGKQYVPFPKSPAPYDSHAVVRDSNGTPVRSTSGNCVRTQWMADCDACAPKIIIPLEERTVYFPFDKSSLTPAAKKKLDSLSATIKSIGPVKSVRVAGFADRLGTPVYNEKLSKARAENVRKYLVSKGIVNAQVVETRWFGDTVPATNCPKKMKRKELIACLQKDRRVEVEVDFAEGAKAVTKPVKPIKAVHHKKHHHKKDAAKEKAKPAEPKAKADHKVKAKAKPEEKKTDE